MTKTLAVALALGLIAGTASAQTAATTTPRVIATSPDSKTAAAPVAGANSFTQAQARSRIEAHGYTNVIGLRQDAKSIWRGKAMKDGTSVNVALDYQGNIVAN